MAAPSYYVQTPDGKKVPFDVPEGADAEQVRTLAARALKQAAPDTEYQRPVLSRDTASSLGIAYKLEPDKAPPVPPDLTKQGSISTYEPSLAERMADRISGALSGLGVNDRYARHVGGRASSALADLTPVGAATEADLAKTAFGQGNYLGALGHGLGSALSAIPEGGAAKAMFLGVMAKNADKAALRRAEEMVAAGADRKEIWNETGWFQGADNKWRFEVPDDQLRLNYDVVPSGEKTDVAFDEYGSALSHPELEAAYPATRGIRIGEDRTPGLKGSWDAQDMTLRLNPRLYTEQARSTAGHELQHFVQGQEGFARGGMVGAIPFEQVRPEIQPLRDRFYELAKQVETMGPTPERFAIKQEMERINSQINQMSEGAGYEGYRRLAGEVEARNVQTRLDMTPGQRKEYAPWETEDVPREDQFVIWGGDQPQGALSGPWGGIIDDAQSYADSVGVDMALQPRDFTGRIGPDIADPVALELTDLYARETGKGAGTKAMQRLIERADEAGVPLWLKPEQPRNIDFYRRFGFERDGRGYMTRPPYEPMPKDFDPNDYPEGYAEAMGWK